MLFDNDRLSHWCIGAVLGWTIWTLVLFIPIFHFALKIPIAKVAFPAGICCAVQLAVTPWLFSARATRHNPTGRKERRSAALAVMFSLMAMLFFYYVQRSVPSTPDSRQFFAILFGITIAFGIFFFLASRKVRS